MKLQCTVILRLVPTSPASGSVAAPNCIRLSVCQPFNVDFKANRLSVCSVFRSIELIFNFQGHTVFRINTLYGVLHIIVTFAGVLAQIPFCKRSSARTTHRCICSGCRIPRSHAGFVNTEIVFVTVRIAVLVVDVKQEIQECFSVGILVPHRLKRSNVVRLQMPIVLTPAPTEIFRPREIVPCLAFRYRAVYRNRRICLVHLVGIGVSLCSRLCTCGDKSDCRSQNDLKCYERGGNNFANVFHSNPCFILQRFF